MIKLQNDTQPTPTNAIEVDAAILDIQARLNLSLAWLTHGYGKTYRNVDTSRGVTVYFPEVFLGAKNYMRITPDNDKQGQSFMIVSDEQINDFEEGYTSFLSYDLGIVFTANLELINKTLLNTEYFQQNLIQEVRRVLNTQLVGGNYKLEINEVVKQFSDVYSEFNIDETRGISHSPLTHFRFNCSLTLREYCNDIPFDRCATILSLINNSERACLSSALGGTCDYNDCTTLLANLTEATKNTCILPTYVFAAGNDAAFSNLTTTQINDLTTRLCTPCDYNDCATLLANITDTTKNTCILPTYDFTTNNVRTNLTSTQIDDLIQWLCVGVNKGTAGAGDFFKVGASFYGTRANGGVNNVGIIYSTDFGVSANVLYNFSTSTMHTPLNLCYAENNIVYGIASLGGNNGVGGVFSYNTSTNVLTEIAHFDSSTTGRTSLNGNIGFGKAVKLGGYLYVITQTGSANNEGAILAIDVVNSSPIIVYPFGAGILNSGLQTFVSASDGYVYEFTDRSLRKIDSTTNTSSLVATTTTINTSFEFGQPIIEFNGKLYWTIRAIPPNGANYKIYEYDLSTGTTVDLISVSGQIPLDLFEWNSNLYILTQGGVFLVNVASQSVSTYILFNNAIRGQGAIDGNMLYYRDISTDVYYIIDMSIQNVISKSLNFI